MKIKTIIFIVIVIVLLGGLFFAIKPKTISQNAINNQQAKIFEIVVKDRKVMSGPLVLQVNEGDSIIIKITVDEPEELHLHGYDKSIDLEKGIQNQLSFTASLTGRFPYELEKSKTEIGTLEVIPN